MKKANTKRDNLVEVLVKVRCLNLWEESHHKILFVSFEKYYWYTTSNWLTHSFSNTCFVALHYAYFYFKMYPLIDLNDMIHLQNINK